MPADHRKLDTLRAQRTEAENHYIDELVAGRLDRRTFLRRGAVLGMSATVMGAVILVAMSAPTAVIRPSSISTVPPSTGSPRTGTTRPPVTATTSAIRRLPRSHCAPRYPTGPTPHGEAACTGTKRRAKMSGRRTGGVTVISFHGPER